MKKHVIYSWASDENPFLENIPFLEAPVSENLPENPDNIEAQVSPNVPQDVPDSEQEPQGPEEQTPMPGAGPVGQEEIDSDLDDDQGMEIDFESEKIDYINMAQENKHPEMMDKLLEMRAIKNLTSGQYKFIEDNIQILSLSRDVDFFEIQKKIYKRIKETFKDLAASQSDDFEQKENFQLKGIVFNEAPIDAPAPGGPFGPTGEIGTDKNDPLMNKQPDPKNKEEEDFSDDDIDNEINEEEVSISGVELGSIISSELKQYTSITNVLLKLPNFYSLKSDLFRKIIAAMTNGIQIGTGGTLEDIFIPISSNGIGIKVCTRIYNDFGNIEIGKWNLKFNDPENFLSQSELQKFNHSGSPEEKEVLRKRVVIESIAENFKDKIFLINIINPNNGERKEMCFNFSEMFRFGWRDGYISVKFKANVGSGRAAVEVTGELIDLQDIVINYIKTNPDTLDEEGRPSKEEIELVNIKDGKLFMSIEQEDFDNFSTIANEGVFYETIQSDLDQEELKVIQRCVPDIKEILLKVC